MVTGCFGLALAFKELITTEQSAELSDFDTLRRGLEALR